MNRNWADKPLMSNMARSGVDSVLPILWKHLQIAYVPFLGITGTFAYNPIRRRNRGVISNGSWDTDGQMGRVVTFNDTDTTVTYANNDSLGLGANDSLVSVVTFRSFSDNHTGLFANDVGAGQKSWWGRMLVGGIFQFLIHDGTNSNLVSASGLSALDGEVHQLVGVVDRIGGNLEIYMDGYFLNDLTITATAGSLNANDTMLGDFNAGGVPADGVFGPSYVWIGPGHPFGSANYRQIIRRLWDDPYLPLRKKRRRALGFVESGLSVLSFDSHSPLGFGRGVIRGVP